MEKSRNYYRRQELLEKLEVPTMSEVTTELGKNLSKVVFQECPNALKKDLGLKPKLKGAGPILWTSPSDLLIGKVCLKPPLTDKHIKALTHEGIIAIGNDIEFKFWNEMELEKKKALDKQAEYLKMIAERVLRVAVKMARDEEKAECEAQFLIVSKEFEEKLKYELDRQEQEMLDDQQRMVAAAVAAVEVEWKLRLENSVEETVQKLTQQFLKDLETQKQKLEKVFRAEFESQNTKYDFAIHREHEACKTTMKQLRHCLECKNLANLMYVLCMERRKCCIERSVLEYKYKVKIQELNEKIREKDDLIKNLDVDCNRKQKQLDVREQCVLEILKQFQKFINYALRATPTQAEFLLNVKKMMLLELAQTMVKSNEDNAPHLARLILPWKSDSESISDDNEESKLTLPDYHECLEEIIPPSAQSDFMPSFYYNNRLYVSQDLRIIAAKDIDISETNVLWNKDVEHMIKILKTSVDKGTTTKEDGEKKSLSSGEMSEEEISNQYIQNIKLAEIKSEKDGKSNKSNISFERASRKSNLKNSIEKVDQALVYCNISGSKDANHTESKETNELLKKILKASIEIEIAPIDTTGLLATKDSLIKIRESRRSSMRSFALDEVETGNMLMAVKESLETKIQAKIATGEGSVNFENIDVIRIPDQIEIKKPSKSSKVSIQKPGKTSAGLLKEPILHDSKPALPRSNVSRESKLLSTKDSLIIHRNSLAPTAIPIPNRRRSIQTEEQIQICYSGNERRTSNVSRLSVTRDSLELIRKQSALSKISKPRSTCSSPINLAASPSKPEEERVELPEYESLNRRISPSSTPHIDVVKIPTLVAETSVNFSPITEIYEVNVMKTSDSPWKIYEPEGPSQDNFLTKPNELKISGEPLSKEHLPGSPSFTINRVHSIMKILKEDSSLMRLFTSCTK